MSSLSNFVKRLRDIMRNDAGINGDAQRIEQIAWLLFLKVYDMKEDLWELYEDGKTVEFSFSQYKKNTLNGTGREKDYESGKLILSDPFTWYVDSKNNSIHLKFEFREMVTITYELDDKHFKGTMQTTDGLEKDSFSLTRQ